MQAHQISSNPFTNPCSHTNIHNTNLPRSLPESQRTVSGKHILITNASHSPGPSIALSFAHAGAASIALSNPNPSFLIPLAAALKLINPTCKILAIACDTTRSSSVAHLFSTIKDAFGKLEIVIANVGTAHWVGNGEDKEEGDRNDEWWDDTMTNFRSTHLPAHEYIWSFGLDGMEVFISITAGRKRIGGPGVLPWDMVKGMDLTLVEFLHTEYPGLKAFSVDTGTLGMVTVDKRAQKYTRDDAELVSVFCVLLGSGKANRLSGCCVDVTWGLDELEGQGVRVLGKNIGVEEW